MTPVADYGDVSGGYSDEAVRNIVAAMQPPATPAAAPASMGVMVAPEVTPTMTYMAPAAAAPVAVALPQRTIQVGNYAMPQMGDAADYVPQRPGMPMDITPQRPAPSTIPGPGGYSAADRFNKFSLPAGGTTLSVDEANRVIDSYESTGGHAFAPAAPGTPVGPRVAAVAAAPGEWTTPTMTPPPVTTMGTLAARPQRRVAPMGAMLGRR